MHKLTAKEEEVMELMWKLGECAPKDIVAQYDEPRPHVNTVATVVQSLERKGFVCCCQSSHDRRHKCISSTEKSRQLRQELSCMDEAILEELSRGLSRQQLETLWEILDVMLDNAFQTCKKGCDENDQKTCRKHPGI